MKLANKYLQARMFTSLDNQKQREHENTLANLHVTLHWLPIIWNKPVSFMWFWCVYCYLSLPILQKLYQSLKSWIHFFSFKIMFLQQRKWSLQGSLSDGLSFNFSFVSKYQSYNLTRIKNILIHSYLYYMPRRNLFKSDILWVNVLFVLQTIQKSQLTLYPLEVKRLKFGILDKKWFYVFGSWFWFHWLCKFVW